MNAYRRAQSEIFGYHNHEHSSNCSCMKIITPWKILFGLIDDESEESKESLIDFPSHKLRQKSSSQLPGADYVYKCQEILTLNSEELVATHIAINHGYIVAVGNEETVAEWITPHTRVIDLKDKVMVPGFIEPHMHPLFYGLFAEHCDLRFDLAPSRELALEKFAAYAKTLPHDYPAVYGANYDTTLVSDKTPFTRYELDKIGGTHRPVLVHHSSMHIIYVNSYLLDKLNISKESKDPEGGVYGRFEDGEPNGVLTELAAFLPIFSILPKINYYDLRRFARKAAKLCQDKGCTSIADAAVGILGGTEDFAAYQELSHHLLDNDFHHNRLLHNENKQNANNIANNLGVATRIKAMPLFKYMKSIPFCSGFGDKSFSLGCLKIIADGSFHGETAWMKKKYNNLDSYGVFKK